MNSKGLPEKICSVCLRPFTWRKKWAKDWADVQYCSKRCRGNRKQIKNNSNKGKL